MNTRSARVLLAKPGLDGHDRGIKVVAMALRDSGAEVIYLGLRRTAEQIMAAAEEEDVDVVGVSVLSGAHLPIARDLVEERKRRRLEAIPVVMGGTIPTRDAPRLRDYGVSAVFPVGTALPKVVEEILHLAGTKRSAEGAGRDGQP